MRAEVRRSEYKLQLAGFDGVKPWKQAEACTLNEKLVDLSQDNYRLEPNASFTRDGKWIVFRSNLHGASHVYAVEVKKEKR